MVLTCQRLFALAALTIAGALTTACSKSESLEAQLDSIARHSNAEGELNGNVLIGRGDQVLYERTFGTADSEAGIDNTAENKFAIASISKPFTAVLIMQLVDAGKIQPDSLLSIVFPQLAGQPASAITLHQLMTHTSGLNELISRNLMKRLTVADLETATIKSGGAYEYSNTGYVCLALVVEALTGGTYEAALRKGILQPAGMTNSGVLRTGVKVPGLARGHRGMIGLQPVDLDFAPQAVDGAASIYATTRDLWRFARALKADKLLTRKSQELMYRQHVAGKHGYGWFLSEQGGQYYPWHSGLMNGYSSSLVLQLQRDETIVILGNSAGTDARGLQREFLEALK